MKIKSTADLPEFFDLAKYEGCKDFGPVEWYACIAERASVVRVVESLVPGEPSNIGAKLARMRARPLGAITRQRDIISSLRPRPAVRLATWPDLERAARLDLFNDAEQSSAWRALGDVIRSAEGGDKAEPALGPVMISGLLDHESDAALAIIDLSVPNAVAEAAFKKCLAKARATQKVATRNRPAVDRWADYKLLPYLDLQIWCMETGAWIPETVITDAIRPFKNDPDHIGDTVAPLARALMTDISPLRALASENLEEWIRKQRARLLQGKFSP